MQAVCRRGEKAGGSFETEVIHEQEDFRIKKGVRVEFSGTPFSFLATAYCFTPTNCVSVP